MTKQSRFVWIGAMLVLFVTAVIWVFSGRNTPVQASASSAEESGGAEGASSEEQAPSAESASQEPSETESASSDEAEEEASSAVERRSYAPMTFSSVHAVWFSYIDFQEQTMGADEETFRARFSEVMANCLSIDVNTLYVQVRPFADAMYPSALFPWSKYAAGRQGVDPGYDPLGIIIELAHENGISVHAWVNPLRISRDAETYLTDGSVGLVYRERDEGLVCEVDGGLYFNPACGEVVQLVSDGAAELCRNYDLDGIHFDDYFYPTTDESFDREQYEAYTRTGGSQSLDDWRRENIDRLVAQVHETCAQYGVPFGISPAGNMDHCYFTLYANVARWMNEPGYVDYIAPQIYWGFEHSTRPFRETVAGWQSLCSADVPIICGLAAYKIGTVDGNTEWQDSHDILARQTAFCDRSNLAGWALYRYGSLFRPSGGVAEAVGEELEALRAYLAQEE